MTHVLITKQSFAKMAASMEDKLTVLEGDQDTLVSEITALQLRILNATMVLNDYELEQSAAIKLDSEGLSMKELSDALPSVSPPAMLMHSYVHTNPDDFELPYLRSEPLRMM